MSAPTRAPRLAMIVSGFPRLSETFALNDLLALDASGVVAAVFATKPGDEAPPQPGVERLANRVVMLPPGGPEEQAAMVADRLRDTAIAGIHAYYAHTPADVAARAAARLGIPYGFSAHARDARKVEPRELARRARGAAVVTACNTDVAAVLDLAGVRPRLVPHGVDTSRFCPGSGTLRERLQLLAVGRLVEKKGFLVLLHAVARLNAPFALRIVGDGPERPRLARAVEQLGLAGRVALAGGCTHADLAAEYASADVVIVPSIEDSAGDRDGLPNVVLEAMASARPVVASRIAAIPTAVVHQSTGWLVEPGDPHALARAISGLAADPILRNRLGRLGRERVEQHFAIAQCTAHLRRVLEAAYA